MAQYIQQYGKYLIRIVNGDVITATLSYFLTKDREVMPYSTSYGGKREQNRFFIHDPLQDFLSS